MASNAPRYVCLSDLHLGAGYSTLTATDAHGEPDPATPSDTLVALGQALHQLLPALGDAPPPTLILLGDVLDMGLSPMGAVAAAFKCFVEAVMLDIDRQPVFAPRVLCVPGNHDHHLWRLAQDQHFQDGLMQGRVDNDLIEHTALLLDDAATAGIESPMLTRLMAGYPCLADARAGIVYPNLGLLDAARQRCVVLHHGHYIDPMYRVVSTLSSQAPGVGPGAITVAQLETQNGPWVDFLWSDLGSAGRTGTEATTLYEVMRDPGASHRFSQRLSKRLVAQLRKRFGTSGSTTTAQGIRVDQWVLGAIDATLGQGAQSQRDSYLEVMAASDVADLRWYLSGPVKLQLERCGLAPADLDLSFVFGHTHKPFEDELPVAGFVRPVGVFNTGGWVMDQPTMTTTQGAAMVLIDDALNIASLRLFNDPLNGCIPPVQARGVGGFRDRANPMLAALTAGLAQTAPSWDAFSRCAQRATEGRATRLLDQFFSA